MKSSIKDFFSKCDHIRRKLRIWSHLLKKSLLEHFIFVQWRLLCSLYELNTEVYPLDTGRKLIARKTFRRCPCPLTSISPEIFPGLRTQI